MCSSNLYSHPGRPLEGHLINVSKLVEIFISEKPKELKKNYTQLCKILGLLHDVGKATEFFQRYLLTTDEKEKNSLKNLPETKHSFFSALCGYYVIKELNLSDEFLSLFAFVVIRRHHGDLIDISDEVIVEEKDCENLYKQIESIDNKKFSILVDKLCEAGLPLRLEKDLIKKWIGSFPQELKYFKKCIRNLNNNIERFVTLNFIYSLLLDADKSDVVGLRLSEFAERVNISADIVERYKKVFPFQKSPINKLREKAYYEVLEQPLDPNHRIYSLNLPTGLGKTLISLAFALKLREKLGGKHRIIYALPFLSIIDQNASIFESIIKENGLPPYTNILLKHHHLSEIFYKKDDNEFEHNEAKILVEGWNSEIIVTTFVQVFHSMISNKNRSLRKFHRFANSIIILDEVQAIPVKYWLLLREILSVLSKKFNSYILLVTATEPLIFNQEDVKQLIEKDYYFKNLNRIKLIPLLDKDLTLTELYEYFNLMDGRTYLFVFNTISAARDFYIMIKKQTNLPATYLSTHLIPKERLKRIKEIKEKKYKVVVSTQLVEAGVDIDFDVVVRDIAPFDSIMQSAGRCNRNSLKETEKGETYIVSLRDERNRLYSSYIYDPTLLDITRKILKDYKEIKENELINLIEEYYIKVSERKTQSVSKEIIEAVSKLRYDTEDEKISVATFQLIEQSYFEVDVFIELDEEAKNIWQQYLELKRVKDFFERKKKFDLIKANFYQYVISVPVNVKNKPPIVEGIGYVGHETINDYYDLDTGYITKESTIIW
ncbi:CRISPR-associated helicase/endonuclease Cas3 [Thermodesulfobacterium thermophilum]|uniref:CRISPR-associated helicase/endonuclease Cas3 n=1 Tax=Thermodesulfobacterium thermophilum TaxID=886 RepID=UPI0003B59CA0|nr:CRISPR-associated helicase/endonuclease Cas3 [Thermodesulfobacterium thermophilum]